MIPHSMIIPEWYLKAKSENASQTRLRKIASVECLKAIQRRAKRLGEPIPDAVDSNLIDLTIDMYEHALTKTSFQ